MTLRFSLPDDFRFVKVLSFPNYPLTIGFLVTNNSSEPWKVSLHGGHSGEYCNHAKGTLREVFDAAVEFGYETFGVSEHAPRLGDHLLYDDERERGWDVAKLEDDFDRYATDVDGLIEEFADRIVVLKGMEIEVVPTEQYESIMQGLRAKYAIEYIVGSVHYIRETSIDGPKEDCDRVVDQVGGLEAFGIAYYETVAGMVETLKPEVVGHLDLIRKNAPSNEAVETPRIREAGLECLRVIERHGCILDLNTAGYRKGLGSPYPAPWLLRAANERGIPFCFGDDSHGAHDVGAGIHDARTYLIDNGIDTIVSLTRTEDGLEHQPIPLDKV